MSFLYVLAFGSGCAAIMYELVWFQSLQFVVGASSLSLVVVLASFMGGMALGSAVVPRVLSDGRHPLLVFAGLEGGIALSGLLMPFVLPSVRGVYLTMIGAGYGPVLVRMLAASACLLLPTMLMGATLPIAARWMASQPLPDPGASRFYAANTAGGVAGALLGTFYVLRVHDMAAATYAAAALNLLVAAGAVALASRHRDWRSTVHSPLSTVHCPPSTVHRPPSTNAVIYLVAGLSGLTALGAEVIWTRQLSLLFGATVYTFSLILAVFLAGIGIGSLAGERLARRRAPAAMLAWCQALLAPAIAYGAWAIVELLPLLQPTRHRLAAIHASLELGFAWDALRCAMAMLPATVLWGASFSLALAAARRRDGDSAMTVGAVNASNTLGSVLGAALFTLVVLPAAGSHRAQQTLAAAAALASLVLLRRTARPRAIAALLAVAAVSLWVVPGVPERLIAYGRHVDSWSTIKRVLHVAEGVTSSVAVTEGIAGMRQFHVAGKVEASNMDIDMRLERMLGHLPALIHPRPRSVLVVGFGAGVTAGTFVAHPEIERIVICEIEPAVPAASGRYFSEENHRVLSDPRTEVIYDDGRHFMETSRETFDIITSDPIHPWVRGAAMLYTAEYFELVKRHLNPGGVVTQWIPLYETDEQSVKSEVATFAAAFPDVTIWNSDLFEDGYDLVALGRMRGEPVDVDAIQARIDGHAPLRQSLEGVTLKSAAWLFGTYTGQASDLGPWLRGARINHEQSLALQYMAGLSLNSDERLGIFGGLLAFRKYPGALFKASPSIEAALRKGY